MPPLSPAETAVPVNASVQRWLERMLYGLVVYTACVTAWLLTGVGGERIVHYVALLSTVPAGVVPIVSAIAAARATPRGTQRDAWAFLALAIALYYVGDAIGVGSWLVDRDPFPGPADLFYGGFYATLTMAAIFLIRSAPVRVQWIQLLLDTTIFVVGFGAFFWYLVVRPATSVAAVNSLGEVLAQLYAALDCGLLLLLGIVVLAGSTAGAGARRASQYLLAGFAIMFLADIVWSLAKLRGSYLPGQFQDCLLYTSPSPRDRQKSRMPSSA